MDPAATVRELHRTDLPSHKVDVLEDAAGLASKVFGATSAGEAVMAVLNHCFESFHLPMAAWLLDSERGRFVLVGAKGIASLSRQRLRRHLKEIIPWNDKLERERVIRSFSRIVGVGTSSAVDAEGALLLIGGPSESGRKSLPHVSALLNEAIPKFSGEGTHDRRQLDLGIAMTAHELRGPLLGARAAVEHLASKPEDDASDRKMLKEVGRELEQLAELVDLLLGWAVGSQAVELRPMDLMATVKEAIMCCRHEGASRVKVSGPRSLDIKADPRHIRGALANVIVNALVYSPHDQSVDLEVKRGRKWVTVRVTDRGHGVPKKERPLIFNPFFRGSAAAGQSRAGGGVGLFVASKVVEAHGGRIRVESGFPGAAFVIQLPIAP
jgi:signal transduction histidine kinase